MAKSNREEDDRNNGQGEAKKRKLQADPEPTNQKSDSPKPRRPKHPKVEHGVKAPEGTTLPNWREHWQELQALNVIQLGKVGAADVEQELAKERIQISDRVDKAKKKAKTAQLKKDYASELQEHVQNRPWERENRRAFAVLSNWTMGIDKYPASFMEDYERTTDRDAPSEVSNDTEDE
ncbi:hypothetical protein BDV95DRAFT_606555 [Massariosphaeria phaeospora]|uniref:Uncharacterized protein n=1 Tax=Massariosphaeria phaeospora TaxID=100035 RepID=A0A7C8I8H6_9PLEO|nr:hypothetical protein BDV95DRAFT_606555 [Massariosphaeria phaeospora]